MKAEVGNWHVWIGLALAAWLFYACASVKMPEGGPKDEVAPKLLRTNPTIGTRNFKRNKAELFFSEDIQVADFSNQVMVSPATIEMPAYIARGKRLSLTFEKGLPPNRTVMVNFREAIKDAHEGLLAKGIMLVFSTGPELDTGSLSGDIAYAATNQPAKGVLVALVSADSLAMGDMVKVKPTYLAKSLDDGTYSFTYIKASSYYLYAFEDRNKNQLYDDKEEPLAYHSSKIEVGEKAGHIDLMLAPHDSKPTQIYGAETNNNYAEVFLNETPIRAKMLINKEEQQVTIREKTLRFYPKAFKDSTKLTVQLFDSAGNDTTIYQTLIGEIGKRDTNQLKNGLSYTITPPKQEPWNDQTKLVFTFDDELLDPKPFLSIVGDSSTKDADLTAAHYTISFPTAQSAVVTFDKSKHKVPSQMRVFLKAKGLQGKGGQYLKADTLRYMASAEEQFGIINVASKQNWPAAETVIQVLDEQFRVVKTLAPNTSKVHKVSWLSAGKYRLRQFRDLNKNGQWDGANLRKGQQPEPLIHHSNEVMLKANWEIETTGF